MLPEDIRNMDFGQASMPHAPEAQTPEVPYDTTTSAPDRPAIPLSPDMLSGNLRGNDSEKSGIEFSFDAFGYTQQVELVQESYADGNLAVTAYLSDPTDESFGQPWSSVTVNFGSPLQQDATVFLDTNNMGEAMLSKISQLIPPARPDFRRPSAHLVAVCELRSLAAQPLTTVTLEGKRKSNHIDRQLS